MHIDARNLDNDTLIEGDVCIVGAGAAGVSIALDWIGSSHKVILLEGGGFEYDDKVQDLYSGQTTGQKYYPLRSSRLHMFGGTTGHWAGMCAPFDPIDFLERDWVPHSGWPITREDLDPFYQRAQEKLELGPHPYELSYWQKRDPAMIPLPLDEKAVWNKMWQFSPPTRFGEKYRDTIVNARNIHLYTYANLTDITANDEVSEIRELTVENYTGKSHRVKARYYVLACGAIQNARMLLASNRQAPNGLGNQHDLVGRFFMEHLEIKSAELWFTEPHPMNLYIFTFGESQARAELAISAEKQSEFRILNGTASFTPLTVARNQQPLIDVWTNEDPRKSLDNLLRSFTEAEEGYDPDADLQINRAYELFTRIELAPNPASRVTLDTERDALGVPRAKLNWELTSLEKRSIRKMYEIIGQQVGLAGSGRVKMMDYLWDENDESWPSYAGGGWHHMGTTKMSDDPEKGVVDANCKVHGIDNLFVAGSSCFATAGAPNPTLTVVALSLRVSDHVKARLA